MSTAAERCMGCMAVKGAEAVCSHCGWSEGRLPVSQLVIVPRTVIMNRYLLGRLLDEDEFTYTYLAWDMKESVKVAVREYFPRSLAKRATDRLSVKSEDAARADYEFGLYGLLYEMRTLSRLNGLKGMIQVRDIVETNGTAYIILELVDGIRFSDYLSRYGGSIAWRRGLEILAPVVDLLAEMHRIGVQHRAICPENIMISSDKETKLLHAGVTRFALAEKSKNLAVALKPGYSAPEQYRNRDIQGPWTDIYGIAATIYAAATGQPPPEASGRLERDTLVPPRSFGINMPESVEKSILKGLSVVVVSRTNSIAELRDELFGNDTRAQSKSKEQSFCPHCGARLPDTAAFSCTVCGRKLKEEEDTNLTIDSNIWAKYGIGHLVNAEPDEDYVEEIGLPGTTYKESGFFKMPGNKALFVALIVTMVLSAAAYLYANGYFDTAEMQYKQGIEQYTAGNFDSAAQMLEKAALKGHVQAAEQLGFMFFTGEGVTRNYQMAATYLRAGAEAGNARAQACLGYMYYHGQGLPKDMVMAFKWNVSAAEKGNPEAQKNLATMYYTGTGAPQDHESAARMFRKSAEQGNAEAQNSLGMMFERGEGGLPKNFEEAVNWYRKSAEQGNKIGQYNLGVMYVLGNAVAKDYEEGRKWLNKSVAQGYIPAWNMLSKIAQIPQQQR